MCSLTAAQGKQMIAIYMAGLEPEGVRGVHNVLGGELARIISQSEKYTAVDRTNAIQLQLAREHTFQRSGVVSDDQIKRLGSQLGVEYLCITNISVLGQSYYLDMRLVDVETAEIIRTATATSNLRNANEMKRTAQHIAYNLIESERLRVQNERKKKIFFHTAIGADVLGAGLLAYGIYENTNIKKYVDKDKFSSAEKSLTKRNAAYIAGGALLATGITIHILF